jgi:hypothetical protein
MNKLIRRIVVIAMIAGASPVAMAAAGDLKLSIANGRVTLVAQDVPLRQILAEWARLGQTTIVNGDKLNGPSMTLQLVDRPEREVLEVLLKSASGYIAAERPVNIANASVFARVMILPTSRGPVGVAAAPPPPPQFGRRNMGPQMQMPPQPVEDEDEPMDPNVPTDQPIVNQPPPGYPNAVPPPPGQQPGQQPPVMTAPRPGMLPAPPPGQAQSPYGNQPPNVRQNGPGNPNPNDEP